MTINDNNKFIQALKKIPQNPTVDKKDELELSYTQIQQVENYNNGKKNNKTITKNKDWHTHSMWNKHKGKDFSCHARIVKLSKQYCVT